MNKKIIGLLIIFTILFSITPIHAFNGFGLDKYSTPKKDTHHHISSRMKDLDTFRDGDTGYVFDTLLAFKSMNMLNDYVINANAESELNNDYEFGLDSYFQYLNDSELDRMIDLVEFERACDDNYIDYVRTLCFDVKDDCEKDLTICVAAGGLIGGIGFILALFPATSVYGGVIAGIGVGIATVCGITMGEGKRRISDIFDLISYDKNLPAANTLMGILAKKLVHDKELRKLNKGFDSDSDNYTWKPYKGDYWINIVNSMDIKPSMISIKSVNNSFINNTVNNSSVNDTVNNTFIKNVSMTDYDPNFYFKKPNSYNSFQLSNQFKNDITGTKPAYNKPYKKYKWYQFWKPIANAFYSVYYDVVLVPVQYAKNFVPAGENLIKNL
jgi:hypothetical protein